MDYCKLMSVAQKNEKLNKQPVACYQTKFAPPKKETKESKSLSENIKKFLARKEEEERQKQLEAKKKKENLLSMRDQKTQNRINKHLKVCKAANKSVLADAVDNENTAITIAGPSQPDEDDYGYTSKEASDFYNRLMDKYNNMPPEKSIFGDFDKKPVKDISSTKDRVKQMLRQEQEEKALGHRRRKKENGEVKNEKTEVESEREKDKDKTKESFRDKEKGTKPVVKKKVPPPPIMDFRELMKLAEKKQYEPIKIEVKPKEEEKPMTKKQQREYQEMMDRRERQKHNYSNSAKPFNGETKTTEKIAKLQPIPKKSNCDKSNSVKMQEDKVASMKAAEKNVKSSILYSKLKEKGREKEKETDKMKNEISEERKKLEAERKKLEELKKEIEEKEKKLALKNNKMDDTKSKVLVKTGKESIKNSAPKPALKDVKPRQFPPPDMVRFKRPESKKKVNNKRRITSDDECDSEMDDFIVDDETETNDDYSKHMSEIFSTYRNKYRYFNDDEDDMMESSYAQQLKEEFVSTKYGILEDLEDIRREKMIEEKKKMKVMGNKKMRK